MEYNKEFHDGSIDLIDDPEPVGGKPWTDPAVLGRQLRAHKTFDDLVDDLVDDDGAAPERAEVQRYIDSYGLHQPTPLFLTSGGSELNHATSLSITNKYGLAPTTDEEGGPSAGVPVRFTPVAAGSGIEMQLEVGDHVTGDRANERRTYAPQTQRAYLRYNRRLAASMGLLDRALRDADPTSRTARVLPDGEHTMRVEYDPVVVPWREDFHYPSNRDVYDLGTLYRPLWATPEEGSASYEDLSLDDDYHFRLDIPQEYTEAYGLQADDNVAYHLGLIKGNLAIMVDAEPDVDALESTNMMGATVGRVNRKGDGIAQLAVYPPMPLVDALEIGTDTVKPSVTLVPGPEAAGTDEGSNGWFGIVPGVDE